MKRLILATVLCLSGGVMAGEINVKVNGMVCSMCGQGITKKFSKLDSVKEIKVNLDNKLVQVITKEEKDISDQQITQIITEAGYNVASIERK